MSDLQRRVDDVPTVFCLHYLGGSAREWEPVSDLLVKSRCVALDLPGFGDAAETTGFTVAEMAASIVDTIRACAPRRWMLAGHSMGAKVAAAVAREIEDGVLDLPGLVGLVLLAGSPPAPEPMPDDQRRTMLGWFAGDAESNRADATTYVAQNANALDPAFDGAAVNDALRMNRAAWRAWLESGSREDWAARVGVLQTPALIVAGQDDENLGPDAQRGLTLPHYANARFVTIAGAKHLLPLEAPDAVAKLIDEHAEAVHSDGDRDRSLQNEYRALIHSDRVSTKTRQALLERDRDDDPAYVPVAMSAHALTILRSMLDRVVPQTGPTRIDIASRIDRRLASGESDGWRFAILPPDVEAYRSGLLTLDEAARREHGVEFSDLDAEAQDAILTRIADPADTGATSEATVAGGLDAAAMRAWFEDVRSEAVKTYVGHPSTLARIGYSGIASGGDGHPKSGFARIGYGEREAWEPIGERDVRS